MQGHEVGVIFKKKNVFEESFIKIIRRIGQSSAWNMHLADMLPSFMLQMVCSCVHSVYLHVAGETNI